MTPLRFAFVLHLHQPVGNFDFVFRQHADEVYRPLLEYWERRALWPIVLHVSGPLIEWLGEHDAPLHDRIGRLAADGRVELLSAGWYEPILAALPAPDRATQLGWMREELRARFGVSPTGLWLTERVWSPELPADLAPEGIEYALVDDHLARRAGVPDAEMQQPIRARHDGHQVDLFAIDEPLRYLIPFRPAPEIAADLRARHRRGDALALFADDGEKFGGWPRTREWIWDAGWLRAFADELDTLRDEGVVRLVTTAEAHAELPAAGPYELPEGSYPEMEGWAGGPWRNFLDRYDEARALHSRVRRLSDLCRALGDPAAARRAVGRAQCNDAYWHGVFGGLYMKHLREGVTREMNVAERLLRAGAGLSCERLEADGAGAARWWAHSARVSCVVDAARGGTVTELVWLDGDRAATDVLTRRHEAYYDEAVRRGRERAAARARSAIDGHGGGGTPADNGAAGTSDPTHAGTEDGAQRGDAPTAPAAASIHDIEEEATLPAFPPVDPEARTLVTDRILPADLDERAYRDADFRPLWTSAGSADRASSSDPHANERLHVLSEEAAPSAAGPRHAGDGLEWHFESATAPRIRKRILLADDRLEIEWTWSAEGFPADARFAPELSLGCPLSVVLEPETEVLRYPIVTVSKCPEGFEEIEQGTSLTPQWPVGLARARLILRPLP